MELRWNYLEGLRCSIVDRDPLSTLEFGPDDDDRVDPPSAISLNSLLSSIFIISVERTTKEEEVVELKKKLVLIKMLSKTSMTTPTTITTTASDEGGGSGSDNMTGTTTTDTIRRKLGGKEKAEGDELPVLIVGAGPVGLALGLMLTRMGVECRIIEKRKTPEYYARAISLQSRSLEIMSQLEILDDIFALGKPMNFGIDAYSNGQPLFRVELPSGETPFPGLVSLVQSETERVLEENLNILGVHVDHGVELKELLFEPKTELAHSAILYNNNSLSEETVTFRYLVGCDGGRSTTRKLAEIPFGGETIDVSLLVYDGEIDTDVPGKKFMNLFFNESASLLMVRISDKLVRFMVPIEGSTHKFDDDTFFQKVNHAITPFKYQVKSTLRKNAFALNERRAQCHYRGNIYLCGDSAHVHSPAGGQGLNTGFQDAYNLAWKLALLVEGVGSPTVLNHSFDEERGLVAEQVLESSGQLLRFTLTKPSVYNYLSRNIVVPFALSLPQVQQQAAALLSEVHITYPYNSLNQLTYTGGFFGGVYPGIGKRVPDFPLLNPLYNTTSSLHPLLKGGFCFELILHIPQSYLTPSHVTPLSDLLSDLNSNQLHSLQNLTSTPLFQLTLLIQSDMFQPHQWVSFISAHPDIDTKRADRIRTSFFTYPLYLDQHKGLLTYYQLPTTSPTLLIIRPDGHVGLIHPITPATPLLQVTLDYFNHFILT